MYTWIKFDSWIKRKMRNILKCSYFVYNHIQAKMTRAAHSRAALYLPDNNIQYQSSHPHAQTRRFNKCVNIYRLQCHSTQFGGCQAVPHSPFQQQWKIIQKPWSYLLLAADVQKSCEIAIQNIFEQKTHRPMTITRILVYVCVVFKNEKWERKK